MTYYQSYRLTKKGFLTYLYNNMRGRVLGYVKHKAHLYKGLEIIARDLFLRWAMKNKTFHKLFEQYIKSGCKRAFAPSVDRINNKRGYIFGNMRFVTQSVNSSLHTRV